MVSSGRPSVPSVVPLTRSFWHLQLGFTTCVSHDSNVNEFQNVQYTAHTGPYFSILSSVSVAETPVVVSFAIVIGLNARSREIWTVELAQSLGVSS